MSLFGTSWDDPKTAAIMGLAGGLLQGNAGAGLQQGLLGYQRQSQINREIGRQDKADARQAKLDAYTEEKHALEMAALKRAAMNDAALGRLIFGDAYPQIVGGQSSPSAASSALGDGAKAGSVGPTVANAARMDAQPRQTNPLSGLDPSAVQMDYLINKGKNLPEWLFKRNTPDMQVTNGYAYDKNRVQPGFMPGVSTSSNGQTTVTVPDGQGGVRVQAPAGALDTYAAYRNADEQAKAGVDLVQVPSLDGRNRTMTRSDAAALLRSGGGSQVQSPSSSMPTLGNANITPEVRGLIESDAAKNGIANPTIRMNTAVPGQTLGLSGAQIGMAPSKSEEAAAEAGAKLPFEAQSRVNESWLKNSYEPALGAGSAASEMLTNIQVARQSMEKLGGTGWGTETKALAASVLSGLGIAPNNAKLYATNVQTFQNAAMSNLKTALDAAKGPQTEGDAARASKLFAQLGNTTQANEYLLDLAQAKAERDAKKSAFYQNALPVARAKGDLQEVDREWLKRSPSIFSMPSMQRWAQ